MLSELSLLLATEAETPEDYRRAVMEDNALLKNTESARGKSFGYLRELYALDMNDAMFAAMRTLWNLDPSSRPLLALLAAAVRDELLRAASRLVVQTPAGERLDAGAFSRTAEEAFPDRFTAATLQSVGQRTASSFTQSGHLEKGRTDRLRVRAEASVGAVVFALFIGHLFGERGLGLYETPWACMLDLSEGELDLLAFAASRRSLMEYRRIGDVAEMGFSKLSGGNPG